MNTELMNDSTLSDSLRSEIAMYVHHRMVCRVPLFSKCSVECIAEFVSKLTTCVYLPGEYVCHHGQTGENMFFIEKGKVAITEIISRGAEERVLTVLHPEDFFGEIALLCHSLRTASCRAVTCCHLLQLSRVVRMSQIFAGFCYLQNLSYTLILSAFCLSSLTNTHMI